MKEMIVFMDRKLCMSKSNYSSTHQFFITGAETYAFNIPQP